MEYLKAMFTVPQFFIENNLTMIIKKKTTKISDSVENMSNVNQLIVII